MWAEVVTYLLMVNQLTDGINLVAYYITQYGAKVPQLTFNFTGHILSINLTLYHTSYVNFRYFNVSFYEGIL